MPDLCLSLLAGADERVNVNVNFGIFIEAAHFDFSCCKLAEIKEREKEKLKIKSPFMSVMCLVMARGAI